ncbi:hypothetical protein QBC38DRAFT_258967 [Podospora fimiseda]|uniref:Uncharacterized protein n=1 Tax=Podospora fimiseda TaxID=252190 RepID=A0AAN7BWU5_9PEZI|nr:hypothetical protein QBC38DRAFT_258967 [Podospora fimiseda]
MFLFCTASYRTEREPAFSLQAFVYLKHLRADQMSLKYIYIYIYSLRNDFISVPFWLVSVLVLVWCRRWWARSHVHRYAVDKWLSVYRSRGKRCVELFWLVFMFTFMFCIESVCLDFFLVFDLPLHKSFALPGRILGQTRLAGVLARNDVVVFSNTFNCRSFFLRGRQAVILGPAVRNVEFFVFRRSEDISRNSGVLLDQPHQDISAVCIL